MPPCGGCHGLCKFSGQGNLWREQDPDLLEHNYAGCRFLKCQRAFSPAESTPPLSVLSPQEREQTRHPGVPKVGVLWGQATG